MIMNFWHGLEVSYWGCRNVVRMTIGPEMQEG